MRGSRGSRLLALAGLGALATALAARWASSSARCYELMTRLILGPVYDRIAWTIACELEAASGEGTASPGPVRVLDVGCGPGQILARLATLTPAAELTGLDLDPRMIERAEARVSSARGHHADGQLAFVVGDVAALPFADASFDLVVSTFSMHHWADPEGGLDEIHRALRPGGRALVWDIGTMLRRIETGGPDPLAVAARSAFGSASVHRRWKLGPVVLVARYDLARA